MSTITVSLPSDGDTIDAADYNTPINTVVNDYNGNITNDNISATAAIAGSKLGTGAAGVGNANLLTTAGDIGGTTKGCTLNPIGFTSLANNTGAYVQTGKIITMIAHITGVSNSNGFTFDVPVAAIGVQATIGHRIQNNSVYGTGMIIITGSTATVYTDSGGGAWTNSNNKGLYNAVITYIAA